MIRYVLFDFDGTLVDSKEVFVSAFNQIAHKYKFKKIEAANLDHIRKLSMIDRFRFLNVPIYKVPFLTREFLSLYRSQITGVSVIKGMETVLKRVNDLGMNTGIVSSNSAVTIKNFVKNNGITGIADVYCSGRLFGKDRVFRKFLQDKKLASNEVLYVCDELRDIVACKKVQLKPIWVSWGYEIKEAMQGETTYYTAHTPGELISIIENEHLQRL
jgi:phosphoglycolate phosphatase